MQTYLWHTECIVDWGILKVKIKHKMCIVYEYIIDSDRRQLLKSASTDFIISNHGPI